MVNFETGQKMVQRSNDQTHEEYFDDFFGLDKKISHIFRLVSLDFTQKGEFKPNNISW